MQYELKVKDLLTPVEEYPHIPHSFTIEEALVELRNYSDRGYRHILVFDERFHLVAVLSVRDLLRAMEPEFFKTDAYPKKYEGYCPPEDASLAIMWQMSFLRDCKKKMQKPINEIMPFNKITTVNADDPVVKALFLMLKEDVNALAIIENNVVIGVIRLVNILDAILEKCE
ncbi:CBS domain-containing protein [Dissulfurispira sp.]|uniref:CBS domain-containing protein n=1 Tax=Dissulfurispira sp. TaxID=2817609 RepID=UPI002FD96D52